MSVEFNHLGKLKSADLPNLYRSASVASAEAQREFFWSIGISLALLILTTLLSLVAYSTISFAIIQVSALLVSLALTTYLLVMKPQRKWYAARALAESIKTIAWRFMVKAEPYKGASDVASKHFIENVRKIWDDNNGVKEIVVFTDGEEITDRMKEIRKLPLALRKTFYETNRVDEQRNWYRKKARENDKNSKWWYILVILLHFAAIAFALGHIYFTATPYWPTDLFVTGASCTLVWLQTKRFQDLAESYSLTAHDINLLKPKIQFATTDKKFSDFVGDAENAFSREHTQWRARRDVE